MEIYERIKQRRLALGMTQDELAAKLGYKSRSTIARIELGENDITRSKIVAFAKAVEVEPGYLLGTTPAKDTPQAIIDAYNKLSPAAQQRAREYFEDLLSNPKNLRNQ